MKNIKKATFVLWMFFALLLAAPTVSFAQCAMCTLSAKNNTEASGRKQGLGLNDGILILLSMPYAIVGVVGFLWYKNSRKGRDKSF